MQLAVVYVVVIIIRYVVIYRLYFNHDATKYYYSVLFVFFIAGYICIYKQI